MTFTLTLEAPLTLERRRLGAARARKTVEQLTSRRERQSAAVYRESRPAGDKLVERIESFGGTRRMNLETTSG